MIFGRPTNQVVGAIAAVFNVVVVAAHTVPGLESLKPVFNEALVSTINIALAAVVTLIAGQTPTLNTGDKVNVVTPVGEPNKTIVV